ncbi:MAG TPA: FGGY family carbohydrate kinase [Panacibacter sp.]|nr:FGGY family carbohydrate kinase [Panacibacter sp.]HNP45480.1 FGGY family carbohydrate kinase [Panacibacter sp.]
MPKLPVAAIFDVGKTNKKLLLFNEQYEVVHEAIRQIPETTDEDGFACEDVHALTQWVQTSFYAAANDERFEIKAVNFSGYGASFVYLDKHDRVIPPLYNYLKLYPENLRSQFYQKYGGESLFSKQTASPMLGNLNSGMQLYRMKYEQPETFSSIAFALHLPQYLSFILTGKSTTDITSIGCHTNLWNFEAATYHHWVVDEGIDRLFAPLLPYDTTVPFVFDGKEYVSGIGLHDSSAALIPYLSAGSEPFLLLSTGTWCISLNPFNHAALSDRELHNDCLCYLSYKGKPVKAARLFSGHEHEQQVKRLADHFQKPIDYFTTLAYDKAIASHLIPSDPLPAAAKSGLLQSHFAGRSIHLFGRYENAYHQLMSDIVALQVFSAGLILNDSPVKKIFVDGGFSKNNIYMSLLAAAFPDVEVYAATVAQASALGAALAIHNSWNSQPLVADLISLKRFGAA